ncbi:hypothetical protein Ctob_009410, partial [Chrysochromulina tobinii]
MPIETLVYKWAVQYALSTVLSSQSGVRAFTPALILSLMAMVNPDVIELDSSMQWLRHPAAAAVFCVLAVLEIVAEFVPAVDHVLHQIMTFVHPVTGIMIAIAPKLGDETVTGFVQAPMAIFDGGTVALIFHLIKLLLRLSGCGCLSPVIAAIETTVVVLAVPLAILFGVLALVLAVAVLLAIVRWLVHTCVQTGHGIEEALFGPPNNPARRTLNYMRREHLVLNLAVRRRNKGLERPVRVLLLLAVLLFQLYMPRATVAIVLIVGLVLWRAEVRLGSEHVRTPAQVGVDYVSAIVFALCVFEPMELFVLHRCCVALNAPAPSIGGQIEAATSGAAVLAAASRIESPTPPFSAPHLAQDVHQLKRQSLACNALDALARLLIGSRSDAARHETLRDPRMAPLVRCAAAPSVCRADGEVAALDMQSARTVAVSLTALGTLCSADAVFCAQQGVARSADAASALGPLRDAAAQLVGRAETLAWHMELQDAVASRWAARRLLGARASTDRLNERTCRLPYDFVPGLIALPSADASLNQPYLPSLATLVSSLSADALASQIQFEQQALMTADGRKMYHDDTFVPSIALEGTKHDAEPIWVPASRLGGKDEPPMPLFWTVDSGDLKQGAVGDCWLIAAVSCLANYPEEIEALFFGHGA